LLEPYVGQDIHFLKVDAEGGEEAVLRGMDFRRFRPWVVVVEATVPMSESRTTTGWQPLLTDADYCHVYFDGLNDFYLACEHMELAARLARPPNVFDEFEMAATVRERRARQALAAAAESLRSEVAQRDGELTVLRDQATRLSEAFSVARVEADILSERLAVASNKVDSLRQQLAEAQKNIGEMRTSEAALSEQLTTVQQAHAELREKYASVLKQNGALRSDLDASEASIVRLGADLAEMATVLRRDRETHAALERQLQQVLNSRSFRWLAPARRLRAVLLPHRR
jgi:hypothetical protein